MLPFCLLYIDRPKKYIWKEFDGAYEQVYNQSDTLKEGIG